MKTVVVVVAVHDSLKFISIEVSFTLAYPKEVYANFLQASITAASVSSDKSVALSFVDTPTSAFVKASLDPA